jgi:hypothetical protein
LQSLEPEDKEKFTSGSATSSNVTKRISFSGCRKVRRRFSKPKTPTTARRRDQLMRMWSFQHRENGDARSTAEDIDKLLASLSAAAA